MIRARRPIRGPYRTALPGAVVGLFLLAGCGEAEQSALDPVSEPARLIEQLWWWMLGGAGIVFGGAVALLTIAFFRRRRSGFPIFGERESLAVGLVVAFGIVIPVLTLAGLFTVANVRLLDETAAPHPDSTDLTIEVIGHQWFWEVRYPGTEAVTANEIHMPTDTRVNLVVRTADVIHSFWVPQLNRKIDMIPGQENRILLHADEPGRFRGECAEFCGLQHANMSMFVFAQPPDEFRRWLANEAAPAPEPSTDLEARGQEVFLSEACADCHQLRGTEAEGQIGPDLTHVAERETLAALTIPNTTGELAGWILDPQHVKPGNKMPGIRLDGDQFEALLAYVESLGFEDGGE